MNQTIKEGESVRQAIHRMVDEAFEGEIDDINIKLEEELILTPDWDKENNRPNQNVFNSMPFKRLEFAIIYATRDQMKDSPRE